jgi:hypothetical protein
LILPKFTSPTQHATLATKSALKTHPSGESAAENCARVTDLGFITSKHITMCGEHFELISNPFVDGDFTTVYVISRNDPELRELRLPVSILVGLPKLFRQGEQITQSGTL